VDTIRDLARRARDLGARAWGQAQRRLTPILRQGGRGLSRGVRALLRGVRDTLSRIHYRPFAGHHAVWRALLYAVPIVGVLLGLCYGWFGGSVALYAAGLGRNAAAPWWLSGMTACGAVGVIYWLWHLVLGRRAARAGRDHRAPAGFDLWLIAAPLLVAGVLVLAGRADAAPDVGALAGLVLALAIGVGLVAAPGEAVALRPRALGWPLLEGAILAMPLAWGRLALAVGTDLDDVALMAAADGGGLVLAALLLAGLTWLRRRAWRAVWPTPQASLVAGLCLAYLVTPLTLNGLALVGVANLPSLAAGSVGLRFVTAAGVAALAVGLERWRRTRR